MPAIRGGFPYRLQERRPVVLVEALFIFGPGAELRCNAGDAPSTWPPAFGKVSKFGHHWEQA